MHQACTPANKGRSYPADPRESRRSSRSCARPEMVRPGCGPEA